MIIARRILWKNRPVANFICTSNVLNCEEPKDKKVPKKNSEKKNKEDKQETIKLTAKSSLSEILNFTLAKSIKKPLRGVRKPKSKDLFKQAVQKEAKNVARELGADEKKTAQEIMDYLKEFEISKDSGTPTPHRKEFFGEKENYGQFYQREKLFSRFTPLNIFNPDIMKETESEVKLKIWDDLEAEELEYMSKLSPKNWFEELALWTEQGKLWHFPIDNDQGMEKEAEINFTEHIFLEQHLEPWCPKQGPLRKFMQMVLIGLSKNYIYTVEEKKAHIDWFRKYFDEKKKLLQELGAMGAAKDRKEIGVSNVEENTKS